jgi:hypothetical protein
MRVIHYYKRAELVYNFSGVYLLIIVCLYHSIILPIGSLKLVSGRIILSLSATAHFKGVEWGANRFHDTILIVFVSATAAAAAGK